MSVWTHPFPRLAGSPSALLSLQHVSPCQRRSFRDLGVASPAIGGLVGESRAAPFLADRAAQLLRRMRNAPHTSIQ
jgi:hypothetical protein